MHRDQCEIKKIYMTADPGERFPDPDLTIGKKTVSKPYQSFEKKTGSGSDLRKKPDPDPTLEKQTRSRSIF